MRVDATKRLIDDAHVDGAAWFGEILAPAAEPKDQCQHWREQRKQQLCSTAHMAPGGLDCERVRPMRRKGNPQAGNLLLSSRRTPGEHLPPGKMRADLGALQARTGGHFP